MIRVFDPNTLDCIGFVENYESFQYSYKYRDAGTFYISIVVLPKVVNILAIGNIIEYYGWSGIITTIELSKESNNSSMLQVKGYELHSLLKSRIVWNNVYFSGKSEAFLRLIVADNCGTNASITRRIPHIVLGTYHDLSANTQRHTQHDNVFDLCRKVCGVENTDYGFRLIFDIPNKQFLFEVYQGADKTSGVVISESFNNLKQKNYIYSIDKQISTVLLLTSDETPTTVSYGYEAEGYDRKESFINSSQQQDELTPQLYEEILIQECKAKINLPTQCFDVDVENVNLDIGDKVNVRDTNWGITTQKRVNEKQITIENGNKIITYLFGEDI